jgi:exonuclease SbcC
MEIKKLILKNFRSHKSLTIDFAEGITGIVGGNGSGKSSVVEAIMFLLTGEGYAKSKSDIITVGQVTGYVIGHMIIDGKEAVLERHLDTAKVNFKYDEKVYKKSSEVNEIWEKLFQIDKNIVQNVIISNQGEIALLFNGDASTREKLFQKIFMVPNTTKLRDVIWNNYVKTAPPEYATKDIEELEETINTLKKEIDKNGMALAAVLPDQGEYEKALQRKNFLQQVLASKDLLNVRSQEISRLETQLNDLKISSAPLESLYNSYDHLQYTRSISDFETNAKFYEMKKNAQDSLNQLKVPVFKEENKESLKNIISTLSEKEAQLTFRRRQASEILNKIKDYEATGLASGQCPTCGGVVTDIANLIGHLNDELQPLVASGQELKLEVEKLKEKKLELQTLSDIYDNYLKEKERLSSIVDAYKDIEYDKEKHTSTLAEFQKFNDAKAQLSKFEQQIKDVEKQLTAKKLEIASVVKYDRPDEDFETEFKALTECLEYIAKNSALQKELELSIAVDKQRITDLKKEIKLSKEYIDKNSKRKTYLDTLQAVYDIFHTSKFPRALIQTYASSVTEYMNEVLSSFEFPYKAEVNEMFGIDVFNEEGLLLPRVSGGQQVMIGLSLRLALHNMFVGAFPLMIIDEGSYGLNTENSKKYFDIISSLGKNSKFKQVIVIDHNPDLSEHVDRFISL